MAGHLFMPQNLQASADGALGPELDGLDGSAQGLLVVVDQGNFLKIAGDRQAKHAMVLVVATGPRQADIAKVAELSKADTQVIADPGARMSTPFFSQRTPRPDD